MGGRGATLGTARGIAQLSFDDATSRVQNTLVGAGVPESIASDISRSIARDRKESLSEDAGTAFLEMTPKQRASAIDAIQSSLKSLGYSNVSASLRKVKIAGTKSKLKGTGSTGATYELQWRYKASK